MTPSQMRAMRARQLLDSGRDAHEVAREMGYTKVSGMLGAIAICEKKFERDKEKVLQKIAQEPDMSMTADAAEQTTATLYPVQSGLIKIGGPLGYVTIKPSAGTVHLNVPTTSGGSRWLMLSGRQLGKDRLLTALKEIGSAIGEAVSLIEEGTIDVDHHA